MPDLWPENGAAWEAWLILHELAGAPDLRMRDVESWARVHGLSPARLARKLAAIQTARAEWMKQQSEAKE